MDNTNLSQISKKIMDLEKRFERSQTEDISLHAGMAMSQFMALNSLRGFWPMSSIDEAINFYDMSGQQRTLSMAGAVGAGSYGLMPYANFVGAGNIFRADEAGLDILADLTFGGWFYFTNLVASYGMINKDNGSPNNGYWIYVNNPTGSLCLGIGNGGAFVQVVSTLNAIASGWYFVAGRYTPSTEIAIFVNGVKTVNVTGIYAAIPNNAGQFQIGASFGGYQLVGRSSMCFLCATALSDRIIQSLFSNSRTLFGA